MKERPIIFSTPMVRAILDGRKTMTRRILKSPLPIGVKWWGVYDGELIYRTVDNKSVLTHCKCPYGISGDRLWVKETWNCHGRPDISGVKYIYKADKTDSIAKILPWKPSLFMPKDAHRICLEIIKISIERLNNITEDDALLEGIEIIDMNTNGFTYKSYIPKLMADYASPIGSFLSLWDSINLKKNPSWNNPWVWVIEFKRIAP